MCQKGGQVFKQFYAVMLTSGQLKSPRFLQAYKMPPRKDEMARLISDRVIGKLEPSPHLYGDNPEIHVVPIHIPVNILYGGKGVK